MRADSRFHIGNDCIVPKEAANYDAAALELITVLLRNERLLYPTDRRPITVQLIKLGFDQLMTRRSEKTKPPGLLDARIVMESAVAAVRLYADHVAGGAAAEEFEDDLAQAIHGKTLMDELERQVKVLREAILILAEMPENESEQVAMYVCDLIYDRDNDVYGLLFQNGRSFTVRLRHDDGLVLKAATERTINALSPRSASELQHAVRESATVEAIIRRLEIAFDPIELRTVAGEAFQIGRVHIVKSRRGLLTFIAYQSPQVYLLYLTILLAALDLVQRSGLSFDWTLHGFSTATWLAEFEGRLSTGAFGAYLVLLFLKYSELKGSLSRPIRRGRGLTQPLYGAVISWED